MPRKPAKQSELAGQLVAIEVIVAQLLLWQTNRPGGKAALLKFCHEELLKRFSEITDADIRKSAEKHGCLILNAALKKLGAPLIHA